MTGWSNRKYVSRTSTSVHQVASRVAKRKITQNRVKLGAAAAEIHGMAGDKLLDSREFDPFWSEAER
jgi:hypothetical protein